MSRRRTSASKRRPVQPSNRQRPAQAKTPENRSEPEVTPWWRKPVVWAGGVATVVVAGVLINVLTPPTQKLIASAGPTATATPQNDATKRISANSRHGKATSSPTPATMPLSVVSEDPLNLDFLGVWAFPNKVQLTSVQLAHLNSLKLVTDRADYLYSLGGYAINADTQLVLQNNSNQPVSILDLRVVKDCGLPLDGTLFTAPPQANDNDVRIGFDLDSADTDAESATGWDPSTWSPDYFENSYISFEPGQQQVLNIRAVADSHSCTFTYQATVLEGKTKFYQTIDDEGKPFRVTSLVEDSSKELFAHYTALYVGGVYTEWPTHYHGEYVQENPKTYSPPG